MSLPDLKLVRLRFQRLPPAEIYLSSPSFELGLTLVDDLGQAITWAEFPEAFVTIQFDVLDPSTHAPVNGLVLDVVPNSDDDDEFEMDASSSFYLAKATLRRTSSASALPPAIRIRARSKYPEEGFRILDFEYNHFMEHLDETPDAFRVATLDGEYKLFAILSACSGDVSLVVGRPPSVPSGTKAQSPYANAPKVQSHIRRILPSYIRYSDFPPLTFIERTHLHNSTGTRLWDSSLVLSRRLLVSHDIHPNFREFPPAGEPVPDVVIIELGAGCGLVGMLTAGVSRRLLVDGPDKGLRKTAGIPAVHVVCTDVQETVDTSLKENVDANTRFWTDPPGFREQSCKGNHGCPPDTPQFRSVSLSTETLEWGPLSPSAVSKLCRIPDAPPSSPLPYITVIASDVLYNTSSHEALLQTLVSLLQPGSDDSSPSYRRRGHAIIAYKHRTEGDDDFFQLAEEAGFEAERTDNLSEVDIWELRP